MWTLAMLAACGGAPPPCDYPATASATPGVLSNSDDCGSWALQQGAHLYSNVSVSDESATCTATLDPGLALNADPIYSALGDQGPQWTYDLVAEAAPSDTFLVADIECLDGAYWRAQIQIEGP